MIRVPNLRARATKSRRPASRTYRPLLEQLEDRSLLNAGANILMSGGPPVLAFGAPQGRMTVEKQIEAPDHSHILVGAVYDDAAASWLFAVARTDAAGNLDPAFGTGGIAVTPLGGSGWDFAFDVLVQADGSIVAVGAVDYTPDPHNWGDGARGFGLVRYHADGSLDTTFGDRGVTVTPFAQGGGAVAASLQADGKIVVVGQTTLGPDATEWFSVARYDAAPTEIAAAVSRLLGELTDEGLIESSNGTFAPLACI